MTRPKRTFSGESLPAPTMTAGNIPNAHVVNVYGSDGRLIAVGRARRGTSGALTVMDPTGPVEVPPSWDAGRKRSGVYVAYRPEDEG